MSSDNRTTRRLSIPVSSSLYAALETRRAEVSQRLGRPVAMREVASECLCLSLAFFSSTDATARAD